MRKKTTTMKGLPMNPVRYSENVRCPVAVSFGLTFVITTAFVVILFISLVPDVIHSALQLILAGFVISIPAFLFMFALFTIKIRISEKWTLSGSKEPILLIKGIVKGETFHIPLNDIVEVKAVDHQYPFYARSFEMVDLAGQNRRA